MQIYCTQEQMFVGSPGVQSRDLGHLDGVGWSCIRQQKNDTELTLERTLLEPFGPKPLKAGCPVARLMSRFSDFGKPKAMVPKTRIQRFILLTKEKH